MYCVCVLADAYGLVAALVDDVSCRDGVVLVVCCLCLCVRRALVSGGMRLCGRGLVQYVVAAGCHVGV